MSKKLGLTTQDLKEKAVSKAQQRYMAMVAHGKIEGPEGLSKEEARKFAKTKHKGLPNRVSEAHVSDEGIEDRFENLLNRADNMLEEVKGSKYMREYNSAIHKAQMKFEDAEEDDHAENAWEAIGELENVISRMQAEAEKRREYVMKYAGKHQQEAHPSMESSYVPSFKEFMTGELFESTYSEGQADEHFTGWNEWNVEVNSRHLGEHTERRVPGWDVVLITHRMHQDHKNWVYAYWDERLGEGVVYKHPKNRKDVLQHVVEKHKSSGHLNEE